MEKKAELTADTIRDLRDELRSKPDAVVKPINESGKRYYIVGKVHKDKH
jgi:hypothetical protein